MFASIDPDQVEAENELLRHRFGIVADLSQHTPQAVQFLVEMMLGQGYLLCKLFSNERYGAVRRLQFTHAVLHGSVGNSSSHDGNYCYHDPISAIAALVNWNGMDEPVGWHRHTATGRRRAENEGEFDQDGRAVPVGAIYTRF